MHAPTDIKVTIFAGGNGARWAVGCTTPAVVCPGAGPHYSLLDWLVSESARRGEDMQRDTRFEDYNRSLELRVRLSRRSGTGRGLLQITLLPDPFYNETSTTLISKTTQPLVERLHTLHQQETTNDEPPVQ